MPLLKQNGDYVSTTGFWEEELPIQPIIFLTIPEIRIMRRSCVVEREVQLLSSSILYLFFVVLMFVGKFVDSTTEFSFDVLAADEIEVVQASP
jgi:hypothetical protein